MFAHTLMNDHARFHTVRHIQCTVNECKSENPETVKEKQERKGKERA